MDAVWIENMNTVLDDNKVRPIHNIYTPYRINPPYQHIRYRYLTTHNPMHLCDDNQTLCLANSERIKLPSTLHMLFEVQDLKVASPATVSRCGMVYMEQVHVGMASLVRTWGATVLKELIGK